MDLKATLKRYLTVCVTITIVSASMCLAKGRPLPVPSANTMAALSPERPREPGINGVKTSDPAAGSTIGMTTMKSPADLKAALKNALANRAVAARVKARLGNVNYRLLRRALDEPKEPAFETQASSGVSCWYSCLRANGVSVYAAAVCAITCAAGVLPACAICAAIGGAIAILCAEACAHTVVGGGGSDKGEILN